MITSRGSKTYTMPFQYAIAFWGYKMVIKGQDPLKIEKKPASRLTTNHVISWVIPSGVVLISVLLETISNFPGNH